MAGRTVRLVTAVILLAATDPEGARAGDAPEPLPGTGGAYCGVYSLYAAAAALGRPIPIESLLQEKYIGTKQGSSVEELARAAVDHGLHCRALRALSPGALRGAGCPFLLHVRRPGKGMPYDHWVLFLGLDESGRNAVILDPPAEATPMPLSEVCALWDGIGLMVSDAPDNFGEPRLGSWTSQGLTLGFVGAFVALGVAVGRRAPWFGRVGVLAGVAAVTAVVWHAVHPAGFIGQGPAIAQVAGRYFRPDLPAVDAAGVAAALRGGGLTVIDARTPDAFAYGHIEGAINVPVFTNLIQRDRLLRDIPKANRVIVYCQSDQCTWAEAIGSDLSLRGYQVATFPAGYAGWRAYQRGK